MGFGLKVNFDRLIFFPELKCFPTDVPMNMPVRTGCWCIYILTTDASGSVRGECGGTQGRRTSGASRQPVGGSRPRRRRSRGPRRQLQPVSPLVNLISDSWRFAVIERGVSRSLAVHNSTHPLAIDYGSTYPRVLTSAPPMMKMILSYLV